jgi:hypothetical protein
MAQFELCCLFAPASPLEAIKHYDQKGMGGQVEIRNKFEYQMTK